MEPNYLICVAIDFGSAYSGYAYSFKGSKDDIKINKSWGSSVSVTRYKTPTSVLTDDNDEFLAFGHDAQRLFVSDEFEGQDVHLYDHFKMNLYRERAMSEHTSILSHKGRSMPISTIISMGIRFFKNHVLECLKQSNVGGIKNEQIRWVLTVPTIWTEGAKQLMRSAALKAGIIDNFESTKLTIALEPEAASCWCRALPLEHFVNAPSKSIDHSKGARYMVVDCGGGTIDIAVHEICQNSTVKEIEKVNGGDWGGNKVNVNFEDLLCKLFGRIYITQFKNEFALGWFELIQSFETVKRAQNSTGLKIRLPYTFLSAVKDITGHRPEEMVARSNVPGVQIRNHEFLQINENATDALFNPVVQKIESCIAELLKNKKVSCIRHIFLVGGFGESTYVQKRIQDIAQNKSIHVLIPEEAGLAVMKGAVLYGHDPKTISSRIARKTYGERIVNKFVPSIHPNDKKFLHDGEYLCNDVFRIWVRKGEEIKYDEERRFTSIPMDKSTTYVEFTIYAANRPNVKYVTERGVERIGSLRLKTPDTQLSIQRREIKTSVLFGGTEIRVKAVDAARLDGDTQEITISFVSD